MTKKYSQLSEKEYNFEVIDRLKNSNKISQTKVKLFKTLTVFGNNPIINGKLVSRKDQVGLVSIAHKVKGSQWSFLWGQAKAVFKDQLQYSIFGLYQKADMVHGNQYQCSIFLNLGGQKAKAVLKDQLQYSIFLNLGDQKADIVHGDQGQKGKFLNLGDQKADIVHGDQGQEGKFLNLGKQKANIVKGDQRQEGFVNLGKQQGSIVVGFQFKVSSLNTYYKKLVKTIKNIIDKIHTRYFKI